MKVHNMPHVMSLTDKNYSEEEIKEITVWCNKAFGEKHWGIWENAWDWICFQYERDFIFFKLRWQK